MKHFGVIAFAFAGALGASGCRQEPQTPPPPVSGFNLVHEFGGASAWSEAELIDFGRSEARRNMIQGWSNDELWGSTAFVWSLGEASSIRFFIAEQRDLTFEMSCWAFVAEGLPPQVVTVLNNGLEVGTIELGDTFGPGVEYQLNITKASVAEGENTLTFRYAYTSQAADHLPGNTDRRAIAVAWDWLRLLDARNQGEARALVEDGHRVLEMPFWSEVRYFLMLPPDGKLQLEGLTAWGGRGAEAKLEVLVEGLAVAPRSMTLDPGSEGQRPGALGIGYESPTIAMLTLRSTPGAQSARGGVRLVDPAVVSGSAQAVTIGAGRPAPASEISDFGRPNVLIYVIDALRADHLGCYGYPRPTSPAIDAFAAQATLFENAFAQSSWTKSTMGSVFSGMGPSRHGANSATDILPEEIETLAERVGKLGWQTAGFITNGVVSSLFGFNQGFDTYVRLGEDNTSPEIHKLSDQLNLEISRWFEGRDSERPFFLYVHASDPHAPYYPREPYRDRFAAGLEPEIGLHDRVTALTQGRDPVEDDTADNLMSLYDGEIAFNDASFAALIRILENKDVLDSTLVILMSDHGEEFYDHARWEHGLTLYSEQLHIPLIIRFPGGSWQGVTVPDTVQQIDILPTVLDVVGVDLPAGLEGRSLTRLAARPGQQGAPPPVISVLDKVEIRNVESIVWGRYKLIHYLVYDQPRPELELYDLTVDPGETRNLATEEPILVGYLKTLLSAAREDRGYEALDAQLDDEMRAQLEVLGYLEH